jgi:hypothetical protein
VGEPHRAEGVVGVHEQLDAPGPARGRQAAQVGDDARRLEEDGRDEHGGGPVVDRRRQAFGQRVDGRRRHAHDVHADLGQAQELAAHAVELAVGRDEPEPAGVAPARGRFERGQEADHQLVRVRRQGHLARRVLHQEAEAGPHLVGLGHGAVPFVVHRGGGVVERLDLALACHVGPRLVGVAGEQQPLGHAESAVVRRQGLGRRRRAVGGGHSALLMAQRSGKAAWESVVRR